MNNIVVSRKYGVVDDILKFTSRKNDLRSIVGFFRFLVVLLSSSWYLANNSGNYSGHKYKQVQEPSVQVESSRETIEHKKKGTTQNKTPYQFTSAVRFTFDFLKVGSIALDSVAGATQSTTKSKHRRARHCLFVASWLTESFAWLVKT